MHALNLIDNAEFNDSSMKKHIINKGINFNVINFNLKKGQELPIHHRDIEGDFAICIIEGEGLFLTENGELPAKRGEVLLGKIKEPHGIKAHTDMIVIATVTPH